MGRGFGTGPRRIFALVAAASLWLCAPPARASSAEELVRIARAHEAASQEDLALRRYMEALALDPTYDAAYLGLGALRARRGDLREAERVYTVALEHLPQLRPARAARAFVRRALGMRDEAIADLLGGAEDDPRSLRTLANWYGEDGQVPAQLSVWRQIVGRAETAHDLVLLHEARMMVRALVLMVGPADPAASPGDDRGVRRLAAAIARRGG